MFVKVLIHPNKRTFQWRALNLLSYSFSYLLKTGCLSPVDERITWFLCLCDDETDDDVQPEASLSLMSTETNDDIMMTSGLPVVTLQSQSQDKTLFLYGLITSHTDVCCIVYCFLRGVKLI